MFKTAQILRINKDWNPNFRACEEACRELRFEPCGKSQEKSFGWIEPRGEDHGALIESVSGHWILRFMIESKVVPGSAVKEELKKRMKAIEQQTGRKPGSKEKREMKEDIFHDFLSKAFTKKAAVFVWIDPSAGLIVIDTGSKAQTDAITSAIVHTFKNMTITPVSTKVTPMIAMSEWLNSQDLPSPFTADRDCVLKATDESKASVKYAKHRLDIEEVQEHISRGKMCSQLAMTWNDEVSFTLTDGFVFKKIDFIDAGKVKNKDAGDEFDATVTIATGILSHFFPSMIDALGGEVIAGQS